MTRYSFTIRSRSDRQNVHRVIDNAPTGSRIEIKGERRSLDQNSKLWAMLSDVSLQKRHHGRKYTPDQWKVLFMHACGRQVQYIPSLDGDTFIPWGQSSSDLSKQEMTDLIESILCWGAENGVVFSDPDETAKAA